MPHSPCHRLSNVYINVCTNVELGDFHVVSLFDIDTSLCRCTSIIHVFRTFVCVITPLIIFCFVYSIIWPAGLRDSFSSYLIAAVNAFKYRKKVLAPQLDNNSIHPGRSYTKTNSKTRNKKLGIHSNPYT